MKSFSLKHILLIYLIIPLSFVVVLLDGLFFENALKSVSILNPHEWIWFDAIFGLPHVLMGSSLMLDTEYGQFYGRKLIYTCLFSLLLPFGIYFLGGIIFFIFIEFIVSILHATGQSVGILNLFCSKPKRLLKFWKFSMFMSSCLIFFKGIDFHYLKQLPVNYVSIVIDLLLICVLIGHFFVLKDTSTSKGKFFVWLNTLMVFSMYSLSALGYTPLAVICIRFPHDITAFVFYTNHSYVRNKDVSHNHLNKIFSKIKISLKDLSWTLPLFFMGLAFILNDNKFFFLVGFISYFHYISESFVWKKGGLHQKNISLS